MKMILMMNVAALVLLTGCLTRAPTTYELDRRAGLLDEKTKDAVSEMHTSSAVVRAPRVPVKIPPLIEKVWVSDIALGDDARLQGTWMFLEVERGRWLDEMDDPGGASLVDVEGKGPVGSLR